MSIISGLIDLLLLQRCFSCKKLGAIFCEPCLASIPPCYPHKNELIHASLSYKDEGVRKAIHALKYRGVYRVATPIAALFADHLLETLSDAAVFTGNTWSTEQSAASRSLLVPVPLSKISMRKRGYNQAEILARELQKIAGKEAFVVETGVIIKKKETRAQMTIKKRAERVLNLNGAFAVPDPDRVCGRHVIVLDDVTTTGTTLMECRKVLLVAGALDVTCVALAH